MDEMKHAEGEIKHSKAAWPDANTAEIWREMNNMKQENLLL